MWRWMTGAGALVIVTGLLPLREAADTLQRVGPILVFLVAITVVAELADRAGVFDAAAGVASRWARGRVWLLFVLIVVMATLTTITLSLDTTAVLLTPVVLAVTLRLDIPAPPFALVTVWLAHTASLLLPISNLTNLLAADQFTESTAQFVRLTALPSLVSVTLTAALIGMRYRSHLRGTFVVLHPISVEDRALFSCATAVCLLIGPAVVLGSPAWIASGIGALVLLVAFAARGQVRTLHFDLLPWRLVLIVVGLFFVVAAASHHGLADALTDAAGTGNSFGDLLRLAGTAAISSNAVNNLPAYLALEPAAGESSTRIIALLIGTNMGALVTVWGSLATLLWRERCRAKGVIFSTREFAVTGLIGVPIVVIATVGTLALTS